MGARAPETPSPGMMEPGQAKTQQQRSRRHTSKHICEQQEVQPQISMHCCHAHIHGRQLLETCSIPAHLTATQLSGTAPQVGSGNPNWRVPLAVVLRALLLLLGTTPAATAAAASRGVGTGRVRLTSRCLFFTFISWSSCFRARSGLKFWVTLGTSFMPAPAAAAAAKGLEGDCGSCTPIRASSLYCTSRAPLSLAAASASAQLESMPCSLCCSIFNHLHIYRKRFCFRV